MRGGSLEHFCGRGYAFFASSNLDGFVPVAIFSYEVLILASVGPTPRRVSGVLREVAASWSEMRLSLKG